MYEACNDNTMVCPPVRGDDPRAVASVLSHVKVDKPWYNINTSLISVDHDQYEICRAKIYLFLQRWYKTMILRCPSMFAVDTKIYGVLYNQSSSI